MAQPGKASADKQLSLPRNCVMHAWLPQPIAEVIRREAERRRVHPDAAIAAVLEALVSKRLLPVYLDRYLAPAPILGPYKP